MDDWGDYNSSPCTSYRRAKNMSIFVLKKKVPYLELCKNLILKAVESRAILVFIGHLFYTPDIRSMWGYIVFTFPFVRSFVRSYVRTFVCSFVRLSVTGSKFLR